MLPPKRPIFMIIRELNAEPAEAVEVCAEVCGVGGRGAAATAHV